MALTAKQKKAYLKNPTLCPYREGNDLTTGHVGTDYAVAWATTTCENCGKEWQDIYKLHSIYELE